MGLLLALLSSRRSFNFIHPQMEPIKPTLHTDQPIERNEYAKAQFNTTNYKALAQSIASSLHKSADPQHILTKIKELGRTNNLSIHQQFITLTALIF